MRAPPDPQRPPAAAGAAKAEVRSRRWWLMILKIAIGVGLVAWLFSSDKFEFEKLRSVSGRWQYFAIAQLVFFGCFLVTVIRWAVVIRALGVPARFPDALRLGMIGLFFNQVAFGSTGGDLIKAYYIARESPRRRAEAVLSVVLDRIVGLLSLMLLGGLALVLNWRMLAADATLRSLGILLSVLISTVLLGGALLAWRDFWDRPWVDRLLQRLPASRLIRRLVEALWSLRGKRRLLLASLALSVVNHLGFVALHVLLAQALLGETPPFLTYMFLISVGQLAFALPIMPGGLGVGESAYEFLFSLVSRSEGLEIAALIRMTWVIWGLMGLVFYLRGRREILATLADFDPTAPFEEALGKGETGVDTSPKRISTAQPR